MLNNQADVILEYNHAMNKNLRHQDFEWGQSRVGFVAAFFCEHQVLASSFKDLPLELWTVKRYQNGCIVVDTIKKAETGTRIMEVIGQNEALESVVSQIKVYTLEEMMERGTPESVKLYKTFKEALLTLEVDSFETSTPQHKK